MKKKGSKRSGKRGDVIALPRGIHPRELGKLRSMTVNGEAVFEGDFVTILQVNSAATSTQTQLTPAAIQSALSGTVFARMYNGTGAAVFTRYRIVGVGFTCIPFLVGATGGTIAGSYALVPGTFTGSTPGSDADVLGEANSLMYAPPAIATGSVTGAEYCSKPSRSVSLKFSGTDALWVDPSAVPTNPLATIIAVTLGTGVRVSYVLLGVRVQFKGFGFA